MELSKRMKNLAGQTFGSLTAIRPVRLSSHGTVIWEFLCVCGNHTEWLGNNAVSLAKTNENPDVPSCGCIRDQRASETNTTHGYSKHPLQTIWQSMKQRCANPGDPQYAMYGGKGVTVCQEWQNDAGAFIRWALSNGWKKGMHIDKDVLSDSQGIQRIYSPSTCQFLTPEQNVGYSGSRANHAHNTRIKLTPEDVLDIQRIYSSGQLNQYELADRYNVKQASIWRAVHAN